MIGVMGVRCLSFHAGYRCRHSGACCSGVFQIPAEPRLLELARDAPSEDPTHRGQISIFQRTRESRSDPTLVGLPARGQISIFRKTRKSRSDPTLAGLPLGEPEVRFLPTGPDGACVFYERQSRLCEVHRRQGVDALPSACRHFPRVFLHDDRGIAMSLSHFCPTAAGLLVGDGPLEIVETDLPSELVGRLEAFDAVGALPPLLRPDLLMDHDAFDAWERAAVATLATDGLTCDQALDRIAAASERVRAWSPGNGALRTTVGEAFASRSATAPTWLRDEERLELVGLSGSAQTPSAGDITDRTLNRYLATKVFGSRLAYECRGLRSLVEWSRVCLAVVRNELGRCASLVDAIRAAELTLVHRVDSAALARALSSIEQRRLS